MAFSGYKFFFLTRKTILAVRNFLDLKSLDNSIKYYNRQLLATIVTYELVLVQFDEPEEQVDRNLNIIDCGGGSS